MSYADKLLYYFPGTAWSANGNEYSGITWMDTSEQPSQDDLDALPWPPAPEPDPVPEFVTMRQARLALLGAGLLTQVEATIAALPEPDRAAAAIEWEYSQEVQRHNGFVAMLAPMLGLNDEQIDGLFMHAATL